MEKYCIGIDIGGTSIKSGLFSTKGELVSKWEITTDTSESGNNILIDVADAIISVLKNDEINFHQIEGIGMGVPGPVKTDGLVERCVNLGWSRIYPAKRLSEIIKEKTGVYIRCETGNDANVAALGELWQGAGKGHKDMMMFTLGTGVGGGLILNGRIHEGAHGTAGEVGHMKVSDVEKEKCNCGAQGCLEQYSSATGIVRIAKHILDKSKEDSALRLISGDFTAKDVCNLAKEGDTIAYKAINAACRKLGKAMSIVSMTLDPEIYLIGGGVSRAGEFLRELTEKHYKEFTPLLSEADKAKVSLACLGNDAGIYGAAYLVLV